jgi:hypothetical protein
MSPFSFNGYDDETPLTYSISDGGQSTGDQYDGPVSWKVSIAGGATSEGDTPNRAIAHYAINEVIGGLDAQTSYQWWIYDPSGNILESDSVKGADTGDTTDTGGQTGGETGQAGGSTGGETGGTGEVGAVTFKFTLYGWVWTWTDKTNADPRLWVGKATEPVISTTGGYGSAQDALDAGKAIGASNEAVMKVIVESEIAGFAGASFIYTDRLQAAQNAVAAEKETATEDSLSGGGTLDLPSELPAEAISMALVALAVVAVGAVIFYGMGANK